MCSGSRIPRRAGLATDEFERLTSPARANRELYQANEIQPKASAHFFAGGVRPPTDVKVSFVDGCRRDLGVEAIGDGMVA